MQASSMIWPMVSDFCLAVAVETDPVWNNQTISLYSTDLARTDQRIRFVTSDLPSIF